MQKIEFIKMHGLGNDFVIIDRRNIHVEINKDIIFPLTMRATRSLVKRSVFRGGRWEDTVGVHLCRFEKC